MNEKLLNRFNFVLVAIVAWVVGIKKLIEPDMWWYIKTGKWIVKNGGAPKEDVFSFSFSGVEWINVKWLYEVIIYWFSEIGGPEFTSIFQSIVGVLMVFVLYKTHQLLSKNNNLGIWGITTVIILFICSYRMTARPETTSHLLSLLVFYIFIKAKNSNIKFIYLWVMLQLFWVNMHEAYATGIVVMIALVFGDVIQNKLNNKTLINKHVFAAIGGSILALAVNPRGFKMILHPFEIFGQLNENKFTVELFSWETPYYWTQWESWAFVTVIGLVLLSLLIGKNKNLISNIKQNSNSIGIGYFFVLILFAYLGFTAYRNIPFFVLMASPILVLGFENILKKETLKTPILISSLALASVAWLVIVSNVYYEKTNSRNRYGLEVDPTFNPIGMAEELAKLDYKQAHFSDFLSSAYPLWKIEDYKSFIDLRDLDVFPKGFFEEVISATQNFEVFEQMDKLNNFQFAYIKRSDFPELIKGLQQSSNWKMKYADPIAILFLKAKDESHRDIFEDYKTLETSSLSKTLNLVFNPLYSTNKANINLDFMAANFYESTRDYNLSLKRLEKVLLVPKLKYDALCLRATVYDNLAITLGKDSLIALEWKDLGEAKKIDKKNGKAYFLTGVALYNRGRIKDAVSEFKISVKYNDQNATAWSYLADCQNALSQIDPNNASKYTKNWFEYMEKALALDPGNSLMAYRLGVSYCERNECDKAKPILKNLDALPFLSPSDNKALLRCKKKCGAK